MNMEDFSSELTDEDSKKKIGRYFSIRRGIFQSVRVRCCSDVADKIFRIFVEGQSGFVFPFGTLLWILYCIL